jgi:Tol biopolymer transport system component
MRRTAAKPEPTRCAVRVSVCSRRVAAFVAVCAGLVLAGCGQHVTSPLGEGAANVEALGASKIAFMSERDGNREIYVMNPDGSGQTNITNTPDTDEWYPRWSPDGSQIAFATYRDGNCEIYVMNAADGSSRRNLTRNPAQEEWCSWAPDGTQFVFTSDRTGNSELYIMNAKGGGQTPVTATPENEFLPDWSPLGRPIAFARQVGPTNLFTIGPKGGCGKRLTDVSAIDYKPAYSPDGRQIAFQSSRNGHQWGEQIWVMNADGTGAHTITDGSNRYSYPTWSPTGRRMAVARAPYNSSDSDIWVMNADGSGLKQLTTTPGPDAHPDWSRRM